MPETLLADDAEELIELRLEVKAAKAEHTRLNTLYKRKQLEFIERCKKEKQPHGMRAHGKNFVPTKTIYHRISDRSEFVDWALEHAPELVHYKERGELLNEFVREKVDNGEPLPPGLDFRVDEYVGQRAD